MASAYPWWLALRRGVRSLATLRAPLDTPCCPRACSTRLSTEVYGKPQEGEHRLRPPKHLKRRSNSDCAFRGICITVSLLITNLYGSFLSPVRAAASA